MLYRIELLLDTSISPLKWIPDAIEPHLDLDAGEELITYIVENVQKSKRNRN